MGFKSDEFKEVKWIINSLKSQLDSFNGRESDTDYGKYPGSSDREGNHENSQSSNKGNPELTCKGGLMKYKIIDHNSA